MVHYYLVCHHLMWSGHEIYLHVSHVAASRSSICLLVSRDRHYRSCSDNKRMCAEASISAPPSLLLLLAAGGVRLRGKCRERNPANNAADTYYEYRQDNSSGWHGLYLLYLAVECLQQHLYLLQALLIRSVA